MRNEEPHFDLELNRLDVSSRGAGTVLLNDTSAIAQGGKLQVTLYQDLNGVVMSWNRGAASATTQPAVPPPAIT